MIFLESIGSRACLSAGGLQKVFTRVFNLAFKKVDNRCKIKVLQRFFFVYSPIPDGINPLLIIISRSISATLIATEKL
jgi:hypothetical protein